MKKLIVKVAGNGAMVVFALTSAVQAAPPTGWCYSDASDPTQSMRKAKSA
jgi:hypothetical protein